MAENDFQRDISPDSNMSPPGAICLEIEKTIKHPEEVNRARYFPQSEHLIATKANDANIYLWDTSKETRSSKSDSIDCEAVLVGQNAMGFAIDWNVSKKGLLLSGSDEGDVCIWDVNKGITEQIREGIVDHLFIYKYYFTRLFLYYYFFLLFLKNKQIINRFRFLLKAKLYTTLSLSTTVSSIEFTLKYLDWHRKINVYLSGICVLQ